MNKLRFRSARIVVASFATFASFTAVRESHAQGCVAIKQMGDIACSHDMFDGDSDDSGRWSVSANYQYFRGHRHFVGREYQAHRREAGSEVINLVNQLATTFTYEHSARTSFSINVPYFHADRSSLYEHDRINRYTTRSRGLGDIVIGARHWLRHPASDARSNIAFGLGIDLPTGKSNVKDTFYTTSGPVVRNVDQSIQPGDGGWGVALDFQAYQRIGAKTSIYATGFYLVTPQETSGTYRSDDPIIGRFSIADQYQARVGLTHVVSARRGLTVSLGGRWEGVPSSDLIGGDKGFRRPGYSISIEPGLAISMARSSFSITVPYAIERNRVRSYADKLNGRHGDAAFADFLVNVSWAYRW
ncbi:hypothetical protein ASA1KI_35120 [Opitutales bacterium ASA1]|uniref:hypothetical protein n=1 Tax=Congregicoccus parvus TaxID=3081749 RepID=UPI002B308433|nr:hypothetical protein ASA1KI_35120 [Opitutales bacterium ASA1]